MGTKIPTSSISSISIPCGDIAAGSESSKSGLAGPGIGRLGGLGGLGNGEDSTTLCRHVWIGCAILFGSIKL